MIFPFGIILEPIALMEVILFLVKMQLDMIKVQSFNSMTAGTVRGFRAVLRVGNAMISENVEYSS